MAWIGVSILKIILILLVCISSLFSYDSCDIKAKILSKIAHEIVKKDVVNIYVEDTEFVSDKCSNESIHFTTEQKADLLFLSKLKSVENYKQNKVIFSTNYYLYKTSPKVFGAFFWQKGRPNIILKSSLTKKFNIVFSEQFEKYID